MFGWMSKTTSGGLHLQLDTADLDFFEGPDGTLPIMLPNITKCTRSRQIQPSHGQRSPLSARIRYIQEIR